MPEESMSKRLAARLKITGKAKAINNNPTIDHRISDLVNRSSSVEQKSKPTRAGNTLQQTDRPNIDNIKARQSGRTATANNTNIDTQDQDEIKDYSLPPISYARSQVNDSRTLGKKENEELQNANLYQPESITGNSPYSPQYINSPTSNSASTTSNAISGNSPTPNPVNQPQLSPTESNSHNSNHQTTAGRPDGNPAQKKVAETTKKALTGLAKKIAANPAAWPWILLGIAILLAIIILAAFIGYNSYKKSMVPSPDGKSIPIEVDPIADKEWVKKILMLSGDKDVANVMKETSATSLKNSLETIKTLIQSDSTIPATDKEAYTTSLNTLILKVDEVTNASDNKVKTQKVAELKNAINVFIITLTSVSPLPATLQTRLPLKEPVTRFNTHPHLGTLGWPSTETPKGYLSPARTYLQTGEGTCDAVDLKVGGNVNVYAAFSGKILRQGGAWTILNDQHKVIAAYGHINLNSGYGADKEVKEGELFGKTQEDQGHLHFELAVNKGNGWKCVTNTKEEVIAKEKAGWPEHQLGKSLWEKMLLVLHSPNSPE